MSSVTARPRRFTGRHLAAIVVGFFFVVIIVNMTMATLASRTFSGALVRNGYVASQDFDTWLAAGRRQAALGWAVAGRFDGGTFVVEARDRAGAPIGDAEVTARLRHPIDPNRSATLTLRPWKPGVYLAPVDLPRGQWQVLISLKARDRDYRVSERLYFGG